MRLVSYEEFCTKEFRALWKRLLRASATYDIGQTYEWVKAWWETYRQWGRWKKTWFLVAYENDQGVQALFPMAVRERFGLRIVEYVGQSKGFATDYVGFVGASCYLESAFTNLVAFLLERAAQWDVLSLLVPEWSDWLSPQLKCYCLAMEDARIVWKVDVPECTVTLELPTDFEKYLAGFGARTRRNIRHYLREVKTVGASFDVHRGKDVLARLPTLFRLNSFNWTVFREPSAKSFITAVVSELVAADEPVFMAELRIGEQSLAAVQGFESPNRCFLHTGGVARSTIHKFSPGQAMYAMLIQDLIRRGQRVLDFGPGPSEYKLHFGGSSIKPLYRLALQHGGSRTTRWKALNFLLQNVGPYIGRLGATLRRTENKATTQSKLGNPDLREVGNGSAGTKL
jgi:CelD/BcsL family acetyltransferase involved in cellulose biosynthesis